LAQYDEARKPGARQKIREMNIAISIFYEADCSGDPVAAEDAEQLFRF